MIPGSIGYELWNFRTNQLVAYEECSTLDNARIGIILLINQIVNKFDDTKLKGHLLIRVSMTKDGVYDMAEVAAGEEIFEWASRVASSYTEKKNGKR